MEKDHRKSKPWTKPQRDSWSDSRAILDSAILVHSQRLSCALGDSCALSASFVHSPRLSCALGDTRAHSPILGAFGDSRALSAILDCRVLSAILMRSRRLSCALDDSRVLLTSLNLFKFSFEMDGSSNYCPVCSQFTCALMNSHAHSKNLNSPLLLLSFGPFLMELRA